jgi:Predicted dinucleotide-binding enzymes
LASAGIEVVIGSRSRERGEEMCQQLCDKWPDRDLSLSGAENIEAANTDIVVVATPGTQPRRRPPLSPST